MPVLYCNRDCVRLAPSVHVSKFILSATTFSIVDFAFSNILIAVCPSLNRASQDPENCNCSEFNFNAIDVPYDFHQAPHFLLLSRLQTQHEIKKQEVFALGVG